MNDRTMIATRMMAARVQSAQWAQADRDMLARHVVKDADALLKALAESEAERPQFTTSDDQRLVAGATGLGEVEFLTPYASPQWWGAVPGDATTQSTGAHDEVGDWREYVRPDGKRALMHVAAGNMAYVDDAFIWRGTPQGFDFWDNVLFARCSDADKARAQDFARSVLEAMEASDE